VIYVVIGRRELGKTTLARYLGHAREPRIILDPRAQWPAGEDVQDRVDEDETIGLLEENRDVLVQPDDLPAAVRALAYPARYYIGRSPTQTLTVIFDEAGLYPLELKTSWGWMMRCSPRERTTIILTAHRPADISTDVRALADVWCIFRTVQEHDLDAIEDRCGAEVRAIVQTLKPYEFVSWNDAKAEYQVHKNPKAWYTPAAAPLEGEPGRRPGLF
jgi:hypothetical protein